MHTTCSHAQSSLELETDYQQLLNDTDDKLRASREQLGEAEGYRDRTAALTQRTSQQILLVESKYSTLYASSICTSAMGLQCIYYTYRQQLIFC